MIEHIYPDLPGWVFIVRELSAGVFQVKGTNTFSGHEVLSTKGFEPPSLIQEAKRKAATLS